MVERVIDWCAANRLPVVLGALGLAVWGAWTMVRTPLDAVPDISDVQVIVATEWPGRSPDLVEDQVTFPIVSSLLSTPRVRTVRGFTDFGISYVYVIFEDGTDIYWARSRVVEYLQALRGQLPEGVAPALGPDATGVGWVYQYALVDDSGRHTLADLRGFQDWYLRYWLASVPGVSQVASIGGFVKQYQVAIDPVKLTAYDLSVRDVVRAIQAGNNDVEGRLLEFAGREYMVRGRGYLKSISDIEELAVATRQGGSPVRVRDVAQVRIGPEMRRGAAELDGGGEVVGGIVIMRHGENALQVIDRVKEKLRDVTPALPGGVRVVSTYDRSGLIRESIGTLGTTLLQEAIVVSLVAIVFLFHFRSALIPIISLPLAAIAAFIPMYYLGVTSNIMSLGGLALAIGELVDASLVMVENAHRRLAGGDTGTPIPYELQETAAVAAARQVGRAVFFALAIIVVSFVPVFMLEAQEGRMFRPLAYTKTFSMVAASLLSITLVPVLMTWLVRGHRLRAERANPLSRFFTGLYTPILRAALRWRWAALVIAFATVPAVVPLFFALGTEFMPALYEGSLLYMPTAPPGLSITEATRLLQLQDRALREFPEVERVFGTVGRADTATDNSPMGMVNTTILLRPRDQWRRGMTIEGLQAEMDQKLQFAGFPNTWTQPIRGRLDMLFTGIKTPVGIKILGPDLAVLHQLGLQVESALKQLPDTRSAYAERLTQGSFIDIQIDRDAIGRHGLTVAEVQEVIQTAIGGETITRTIEGRERYPVNVRYERAFRDDLPALGRVLVRTPAGAQVPLGQLAAIELTSGPAMIRNENGQLSGYVYVDTTTADLGGYVERARAAIAATVAMPPGYTVSWTGQYEFQVRARKRLQVLVPLVVLTIFVLLYFTFRSASEAVIVMLSVVYAMTGGIVTQWLFGYNFSVAVWIGYIALFGVAVQTGVVMVVYLHEALDERLTRTGVASERIVWEATISGSVLRLRPKLMTVTTTVASLVPLLWSTGVGADVMKPIAAPIIGGMVTSTIHVLIITPVIFYMMKVRSLRRGQLAPLVRPAHASGAEALFV